MLLLQSKGFVELLRHLSAQIHCQSFWSLMTWFYAGHAIKKYLIITVHLYKFLRKTNVGSFFLDETTQTSIVYWGLFLILIVVKYQSILSTMGGLEYKPMSSLFYSKFHSSLCCNIHCMPLMSQGQKKRKRKRNIHCMGMSLCMYLSSLSNQFFFFFLPCQTNAEVSRASFSEK